MTTEERIAEIMNSEETDIQKKVLLKELNDELREEKFKVIEAIKSLTEGIAAEISNEE